MLCSSSRLPCQATISSSAACSRRAAVVRPVVATGICPRGISCPSQHTTGPCSSHAGVLHAQHASTQQQRQHRRRHLQLAAATPAAAGGGPAHDPTQQQQQQQLDADDASLPAATQPALQPAATQAAGGGLHEQLDDGEHLLDELTADDNVILLMGSEEEDEGEEEGQQQQQQEDFAIAMAAARQELLSSSSSGDDDGWDDSWDTPYAEDFWSTEKERVYLVGVTYKQQYQQQQQRQQQQRHAAGTSRRGLFDLSGSSSGSGSNGGRLSAAAAAAVAAAGELAPGSSGGSSGSSGRRGSSAGGSVSYSVDESIEELGRLAETAGLQVVGSTYQVLESPNPATYIGSGKVAEVAAAVQAAKADTVVFDDELSPGQLRNLEKAFSGGEGGRQVAVADRTALILDIFSQRARTREGKLQVDLAQTEYQLPRLTRMWTHLDRVTGGGQVKGVGEKQIEIDKRLLRDKAAALRRELEAVRTHRAAHRSRRQDAPIPVAALVGYTNAGKSTLLNTLTQAGVLAEDKLFATLDPTTRKVRLSGNLEVLFSDTVGFIQKLPTQLVAAFRATLEEIAAASVVVHVLDISAPNAAAQCSAVLQVLDEIGANDLPMITAWNKVDACSNPAAVRALAAARPDVVAVSGATGEGLQELLELVAVKLAENMVDMQVLLPYSQGALLDELHKMGKVSDTTYTETGTLLTASVPRSLAGKLKQYTTAAGSNGSSSTGSNGGSSGSNGSSADWLDATDMGEDALEDGVVQLVEEVGSWQQQQQEFVLSRGSSNSSSMSSV